MLSAHISTQIYSKFTFQPTVGQKFLIEKLSEFVSTPDPESILMVNGYAGTGKTTVVSALVRALRGMKIPCVLLAPTGRAAKVMSQFSGAMAYTIHKKIYRQRTLASESSRFELDVNRHRGAIFVVDEASMLSNYGGDAGLFGSGCLLDDLVRYVRSGPGCRLIVVGDRAQLPPVGLDYSPALDPRAMGVYGPVEAVSLDEVMRQSQESGILFNATLVRCMIEEEIADIPMFRLDGFPDVKHIDGGGFLEELSEAYDRYGMENTIVITRSNKRANQFNEGIRRHILCREEELSSGDMLMVVKNNYHFLEQANREQEEAGTDESDRLGFIANGDIAELVRIRRFDEQFGFRFAEVLLRFPDYDGLELECRIILDTLQSASPSLTTEQSRQLFHGVEQDYAELTTKAKRYKAIREDPYYNAMQVKFAYAVTCHKAQGGQWRAVFIDKMLFGEEEMTRDLLRWLYTALTRATDRVCFVNFDERFFE
ncbi:MAG: AAA family ATPase [Rikenellaceae bacterium]|jgi:exodeoxyribonuclease-5|nr:AAA family ATPase [Rikenellaceae bacterium]